MTNFIDKQIMSGIQMGYFTLSTHCLSVYHGAWYTSCTHKCLLSEGSKLHSFLRIQFMAIVVASDISYGSSCCIPRWCNLVKDRAGWAPLFVLKFWGGFSCCNSQWGLCKGMVHEYFEIVSSGTINIQSYPPTLCYSELFKGKGWARLGPLVNLQ